MLPRPTRSQRFKSWQRRRGWGGFQSAGRTISLVWGMRLTASGTPRYRYCESLSAAFLPQFREKGFKNLAMPAQRLTVITLKDKESYRAFLGEDPGKMVGGHYDLDTNRLVMFDFRPTIDEIDLQADPERVNLLALVHETTHLLCFNTGLLSRQADVPDWVSEGLATYVELWQKNKKPATPIGVVNRPWLMSLRCGREPGSRSQTWLPTMRILG